MTARPTKVIKERRQHPRVVRPLDGSWLGSSGSSGRCRITDLSVGGCFVQSLAAPAKGELTTVTITIGAHSFTLQGRVVDVDPALGFSVQFTPVAADEAGEFRRVFNALLEEPAHRTS